MKVYDKEIYQKQESIKNTAIIILVFLLGFAAGFIANSFANNTENKDNKTNSNKIIIKSVD